MICGKTPSLEQIDWVQVVSAVVSILCVLLSAFFANRARKAEYKANRLRDLEERAAQRKWELYAPFLKTFGDILTPSRTVDAMKEGENMMSDFQSFVTI